MTLSPPPPTTHAPTGFQQRPLGNRRQHHGTTIYLRHLVPQDDTQLSQLALREETRPLCKDLQGKSDIATPWSCQRALLPQECHVTQSLCSAEKPYPWCSTTGARDNAGGQLLKVRPQTATSHLFFIKKQLCGICPESFQLTQCGRYISLFNEQGGEAPSMSTQGYPLTEKDYVVEKIQQTFIFNLEVRVSD